MQSSNLNINRFPFAVSSSPLQLAGDDNDLDRLLCYFIRSS